MSDSKHRPEPESPKPARPDTEQDEEQPASAKPYVFKIVPANPKNTLDFEDVADK